MQKLEITKDIFGNEIIEIISTDLRELNITQAERVESAHYDAMAKEAANKDYPVSKIPIGKQVR